MMRRFSVLILFLFFTLVAFCQLPKITFTPHWLPQAQFAGYYVALEKGFYLQEGIDVSITHPSASVMATDKLVKGESDVISLFLITAISAKSNGLDVVNIAQLSQNSALLWVSKKEKNLVELSDFNGTKIGIWESGFDEIPKAFVRSNNMDITWVPILSTINMFMLDGIDAMTVMWYNEYDQIINAGINPDELNTFFFSEHGFNVPEDGIYCLNKTLNERPADLEKFVKGTLKGWEFAKQNPDETLEIVLKVMKQAHQPTNKAHQQWMLERLLELVEPGEKPVLKGELLEDDFNKAQKLLIENKYINTAIHYKDFYKSCLKR